jgi:hypothetical protein
MLSGLPDETDLFEDMVFSIGTEDGFVQLKKSILPDVLYKDSHSNAVGKVWENAHREVATLLVKYADKETDIFEPGGATGILNKLFHDLQGEYKSWTILEPQPCPILGCHAEFIRGFFPKDVPDRKYDIIVHTHTMEHMEKIDEFLNNILVHLKENGFMIFSLPDMKALMEQGVLSVVNFEHSYYLAEQYVDVLCKRYGFDIVEKQHFGNGHSLIYVTQYTGNRMEVSVENIWYQKNRELFLNWFTENKNKVTEWNHLMENSDLPCYLFGGHISTQFYQAFGLNLDKIRGILDNDKTKRGKRVCGTALEILSPEELKGFGDCAVILPKSPYAEEIKRGLKEKQIGNLEFWS